MRKLALLPLLLASTALAQAPSPAQMGITAGPPQQLQVLDKNKIWTPLGSAANGVFTPVMPGTGTDVRMYGAKCDGTTDDADAIQATMDAVKLAIIPARCRISKKITIPDNGSLGGLMFAPGRTGTDGSVLLCDATIHGPCVTGGNGTHAPFVFHDIVVARGAGVVPSDGECFYQTDNEETRVENVECYNHAQGFETHNGLGIYFSNIHTCKISDSHFIQNGSTQVFVADHSYFGCNGAFDLDSSSYVRITGNFDQSVGGLDLLDTQFNQGNAATRVACAFSFENFGGAGRFQGLKVLSGHVEVAKKGFCSDSTVKQLLYINVNGASIYGGWGGANALFDLDPATSIFFWAITGNAFGNWASATLAPAATMDAPTISGNVFAATPVSITFPPNASISMEGNSYSGLTLTGTIGAPSKIGGSTRSSPNPYNYTGLTGQVEIDIPGHSGIPCTIGLTFGGASTGMTTSSTRCGWQMRGSLVTVSYSIFLTSKGTSTGSAQLTGLPLAASATAATLNPMTYANMATTCVTGVPNCGIYAAVQVSGTGANLGTWGPSNMIALTDANFTNTSNLQGAITYVWGGGP